MFKEALRPAWVEVNLAHLDYNLRQIRSKIGFDKAVIGVVKADGYGHGAVQVSKVLLNGGAASLAVATLGEAIALRKAGFTCSIIVLALTPSLYVDTLAEYDLTAVCASYENALDLNKAGEKAGKVIPCFIAVDTGMGRIGFLPHEKNIADINKISQLKHLHLLGIVSHFASADEADLSYANEQLARYESFCASLRRSQITVKTQSIANSAAIMELPDSHFDAVRPGIILYGCYPSQEVDRSKLLLKPVMTVKTAIVQLKKLPAGSYISYGCIFQTKRESIIGTLEIGYADGYPRALNGNGRVIVGGKYAPVVGNICMDQCMIDVTDVPGVKENDEVIIMGTDGELAVTAEEIAQKTHTINYEILCSFGQRLPKVYIESI